VIAENAKRLQIAEAVLVEKTREWEKTRRLRAAENDKASRYTLSSDLQKMFDAAYHSIQGPPGFVHNRAMPLRAPNGLKSVHYIHMCESPVLRWLFAHVFDGDAYLTMKQFASMFECLFVRSSSPNHRTELLSRIRRDVQQLESRLPATMHSRMLHLPVHMAEMGVSVFGRCSLWWMFVFERYESSISGVGHFYLIFSSISSSS
jgi:hypothetical protein